MKVHSAGNIDFKPWWSGLHLCCPDCGSIYELESDDKSRLFFSDSGKDYESLIFECNRCGHNIYAKRYLIEALRKSLIKNFRMFEMYIDDLPIEEWDYIQKYLNSTGFKRDVPDISGCSYDISKLGYCGNVLNNGDKL